MLSVIPVVETLPVVTGEHKNWIGLSVHPPTALIDTAETWKPKSADHPFPSFTQGKGSSQIPYHITIVYGFDPIYYLEIEKMVMDATITKQDLKIETELSEFIPSDEKRKHMMYLCAKVTCPKIMDLKRALRKKYVIHNPHEFDHHLIEPHITFRGFTSHFPILPTKHIFLRELMEDRPPFSVHNKLSFSQMNRICCTYWASQAGLDLQDRPTIYPPRPQLTPEELAQLEGPLVTLPDDEPTESRDYFWIIDQLNLRHQVLCRRLSTAVRFPTTVCDLDRDMILQQLKNIMECVKGMTLIPIQSSCSMGSSAMISGYQSYKFTQIFARQYFVMYWLHHPRTNGTFSATTTETTITTTTTTTPVFLPVLSKFDEQAWDTLKKALLQEFDSCYQVIPLRPSVSNLYIRNKSDMQRTSTVFIAQNQEFVENVVRQVLEELDAMGSAYPYAKPLLQSIRTAQELKVAESNKWKGISQQFTNQMTKMDKEKK